MLKQGIKNSGRLKWIYNQLGWIDVLLQSPDSKVKTCTFGQELHRSVFKLSKNDRNRQCRTDRVKFFTVLPGSNRSCFVLRSDKCDFQEVKPESLESHYRAAFQAGKKKKTITAFQQNITLIIPITFRNKTVRATQTLTKSADPL